MKKVLLIGLILLVIGAAAVAWLLLGPGTAFEGEKETLYIRTRAATKGAVLDSLQSNKIIKNESLFNILASQMKY